MDPKDTSSNSLKEMLRLINLLGKEEDSEEDEAIGCDDKADPELGGRKASVMLNRLIGVLAAGGDLSEKASREFIRLPNGQFGEDPAGVAEFQAQQAAEREERRADREAKRAQSAAAASKKPAAQSSSKRAGGKQAAEKKPAPKLEPEEVKPKAPAVKDTKYQASVRKEVESLTDDAERLALLKEEAAVEKQEDGKGQIARMLADEKQRQAEEAEKPEAATKPSAPAINPDEMIKPLADVPYVRQDPEQLIRDQAQAEEEAYSATLDKPEDRPLSETAPEVGSAPSETEAADEAKLSATFAQVQDGKFEYRGQEITPDEEVERTSGSKEDRIRELNDLAVEAAMMEAGPAWDDESALNAETKEEYVASMRSALLAGMNPDERDALPDVSDLTEADFAGTIPAKDADVGRYDDVDRTPLTRDEQMANMQDMETEAMAAQSDLSSGATDDPETEAIAAISDAAVEGNLADVVGSQLSAASEYAARAAAGNPMSKEELSAAGLSSAGIPTNDEAFLRWDMEGQSPEDRIAGLEHEAEMQETFGGGTDTAAHRLLAEERAAQGIVSTDSGPIEPNPREDARDAELAARLASGAISQRDYDNAMAAGASIRAGTNTADIPKDPEEFLRWDMEGQSPEERIARLEHEVEMNTTFGGDPGVAGKLLEEELAKQAQGPVEGRSPEEVGAAIGTSAAAAALAGAASALAPADQSFIEGQYAGLSPVDFDVYGSGDAAVRANLQGAIEQAGDDSALRSELQADLDRFNALVPESAAPVAATQETTAASDALARWQALPVRNPGETIQEMNDRIAERSALGKQVIASQTSEERAANTAAYAAAQQEFSDAWLRGDRNDPNYEANVTAAREKLDATVQAIGPVESFTERQERENAASGYVPPTHTPRGVAYATDEDYTADGELKDPARAAAAAAQWDQRPGESADDHEWRVGQYAGLSAPATSALPDNYDEALRLDLEGAIENSGSADPELVAELQADLDRLNRISPPATILADSGPGSVPTFDGDLSKWGSTPSEIRSNLGMAREIDNMSDEDHAAAMLALQAQAPVSAPGVARFDGDLSKFGASPSEQSQNIEQAYETGDLWAPDYAEARQAMGSPLSTDELSAAGLTSAGIPKDPEEFLIWDTRDMSPEDRIAYFEHEVEMNTTFDGEPGPAGRLLEEERAAQALAPAAASPAVDGEPMGGRPDPAALAAGVSPAQLNREMQEQEAADNTPIASGYDRDNDPRSPTSTAPEAIQRELDSASSIMESAVDRTMSRYSDGNADASEANAAMDDVRQYMDEEEGLAGPDASRLNAAERFATSAQRAMDQALSNGEYASDSDYMRTLRSIEADAEARLAEVSLANDEQSPLAGEDDLGLSPQNRANVAFNADREQAAELRATAATASAFVPPTGTPEQQADAAVRDEAANTLAVAKDNAVGRLNERLASGEITQEQRDSSVRDILRADQTDQFTGRDMGLAPYLSSDDQQRAAEAKYQSAVKDATKQFANDPDGFRTAEQAALETYRSESPLVEPGAPVQSQDWKPGMAPSKFARPNSLRGQEAARAAGNVIGPDGVEQMSPEREEQGRQAIKEQIAKDYQAAVKQAEDDHWGDPEGYRAAVQAAQEQARSQDAGTADAAIASTPVLDVPPGTASAGPSVRPITNSNGDLATFNPSDAGRQTALARLEEDASSLTDEQYTSIKDTINNTPDGEVYPGSYASKLGLAESASAAGETTGRQLALDTLEAERGSGQITQAQYDQIRKEIESTPDGEVYPGSYASKQDVLQPEGNARNIALDTLEAERGNGQITQETYDRLRKEIEAEPEGSVYPGSYASKQGLLSPDGPVAPPNGEAPTEASLRGRFSGELRGLTNNISLQGDPIGLQRERERIQSEANAEAEAAGLAPLFDTTPEGLAAGRTRAINLAESRYPDTLSNYEEGDPFGVMGGAEPDYPENPAVRSALEADNVLGQRLDQIRAERQTSYDAIRSDGTLSPAERAAALEQADRFYDDDYDQATAERDAAIGQPSPRADALANALRNQESLNAPVAPPDPEAEAYAARAAAVAEHFDNESPETAAAWEEQSLVRPTAAPRTRIDESIEEVAATVAATEQRAAAAATAEERETIEKEGRLDRRYLQAVRQAQARAASASLKRGADIAGIQRRLEKELGTITHNRNALLGKFGLSYPPKKALDSAAAYVVQLLSDYDANRDEILRTFKHRPALQKALLDSLESEHFASLASTVSGK